MNLLVSLINFGERVQNGCVSCFQSSKSCTANFALLAGRNALALLKSNDRLACVPSKPAIVKDPPAAIARGRPRCLAVRFLVSPCLHAHHPAMALPQKLYSWLVSFLKVSSNSAPVFNASVETRTSPHVIHVIGASCLFIRVGRPLAGAAVVARDRHLQLLHRG